MKFRGQKSLFAVACTVLLAITVISCSSGGGGGTTAGTPLDNNALLSSLGLSTGALSPVFSSATTTYTSDVSVSTVSTGVTASAGSAKATMKINGTTVVSGATHTVSLPVGQTDIAVVVTAEDGTTSKTYTVTASRPAIGLSPATVDVVAGHDATLNAVLAAAAVGDTVVTLSSSDTGAVTVPPSVTIPSGNSQAPFFGTSISAGPVAVTILATLNSDTATATVNVLSALCNNGTIDFGEQCDDGGIVPGDGCSAVCQTETGWNCSGEPSVCAPVCGDGQKRGSEQCDAGAGNDTTTCGCQDTCTYALVSVSCVAETACTNAMSCDGAGSCPLVTNKNNGTVCTLDNATASCTSGVCRVLSCSAGFRDCDAASANGCESNTQTDSNNCVTCGFICGASQSCVNGGCQFADGTVCDDGNLCTNNDHYTGGVCAGTLASAGYVCRPAAGPCDVAESCDGVSAACPADAVSPAGSVCRASAGVCDVAELCTGVSAACPADATAPNGTACNDGSACTQTDTCQAGVCTGSNPVTCAASDQCHTTGTCDPATGMCSNPAKTNGTSCDDGSACTSGDVCTNGACTGGSPVVCAASDQCHNTGTCDPATGVCSNPAKADGTACNDGNVCTSNDVCAAGVCASSTWSSSATLCRANNGGGCDVAEYCTGSSPVCPADLGSASGTVCRASAGACDLAEVCNGTSAACPANQFAAAGTACGLPAMVCDGAGVCN